MKAISLTQPWATLVAIGAKQIETRSWGTPYRGPIAIHAAKGFPRWAKDLAECSGFQSYLRPAGFGFIADLPRGCVVATARLTACKLIVDTERGLGPCADAARMLPPPDPEYSFGDYAPGRYGWILTDVSLFKVPSPATGKLGLWEWDRPVATPPNSVSTTVEPLDVGGALNPEVTR